MRKNTIIGIAATLVLGVFGAVTTAQATIISASPNVSFQKKAYTLSLADGAATYSFKKGPADGYGGNEAKIKTGGSALVAALNAGGAPDALQPFSTATVDGNFPADYLAHFKAFKSFATIPYSSGYNFLALSFALDDGLHYGYAELNGTELLNYGYESVAGAGIQLGATSDAPTPVPEPGSLVMLAFGLALVGAGTAAARRRKS